MSDEKKLSVCQNYVAAFSCCGKALSVQYVALEFYATYFLIQRLTTKDLLPIQSRQTDSLLIFKEHIKN